MGDVLVTGASGGIGSAVAMALVSAGHHVILLGRDAAALEQVPTSGVRIIVADLAHVEALREAVGEIDQLDALVHCAGISPVAAVADSGTAIWQDTLIVNVAAAAELTRLFLPALLHPAIDPRRNGHLGPGRPARCLRLRAIGDP
jgi:NADP-dependent 3-hydroxy acid dehydrogenase YdfG